jgi:hypothetical protein
MVKYGVGEIICLTCQSGIIIKTQILRDKKWEICLLKKSCDHFTFSIDLFTKDTYLMFKRDEIRFQLNATCNVCDRKEICSSMCNTLNAVKTSSRQFTCHANTAQFKWGYWPNFWAEIYDLDKYENKFTLVKDNDYLKKLTFEESSDYIKDRKQVRDHLKEGVYLPASNRYGELIRPDGTYNYPYEIEYQIESNGHKHRSGSIVCGTGNNNVYVDFSIDEMNKSIKYSLGTFKKMLHSLVALVDIDVVLNSEKPRNLYGWSDPTSPFRGDKKYFDFMALNRKFQNEKAYTDKLVRVDLIGYMSRPTNGLEVKYANLQIKIDNDSFSSIFIPCDIQLGQHNLRNLLIESINSTSTVIMEPYSQRNNTISHWAAAILVKKLKKVLWYFKMNEL